MTTPIIAENALELMLVPNDGTEFLLVISNIFFLLPVITAAYTGYPFHELHFLLVTLTSSFYHACQEYGICPFDLSQHAMQVSDFTLAQMSVILSFMLAIPDQWGKNRHVTTWTYIIFFILSALQASTGFISPTLWIGYIVLTLMAFIFCGAYIYYIWYTTGQYVQYSWKHWLLYLGFSGFGLLLFALQDISSLHKYYNYIHSPWHVFVAIGQFNLMYTPTELKPFPIYAKISGRLKRELMAGKGRERVVAMMPGVRAMRDFLNAHVARGDGRLMARIERAIGLKG